MFKNLFISNSHGFRDGDKITLSGSDNSECSGSFVVVRLKQANIKILITLFVGILLGIALSCG